MLLLASRNSQRAMQSDSYSLAVIHCCHETTTRWLTANSARGELKLNDQSRMSRGPLSFQDTGARDSFLVRSVPYAIGLLIVAVIAVGLYFRDEGAKRPVVQDAAKSAVQEPPPSQSAQQAAEQSAQQSVPQPTAPPATAEREVHHPLPTIAIPDSLAAKPVPPLGESDGPLQQALAAPLGQRPVSELVISKDIARHIVATIDNLPRQKGGTKLLPVKAPAQRFATGGKGEAITLSPLNYARYAAYVKLLRGVDVKQAVALYVHYYPLFQQAYEELGYPKKYFNDRLIEAIDDLLAAPEIRAPVKLVQPKVLYEFADPDLEDLSSGQKLLIRMGPDNAEAVKAKLRELRAALVSTTASNR